MYLVDRPGAARPEPTINMVVRHGVRSALEYRVVHRTRLWKRGERLKLEVQVLEGAPNLSI